MDGLPQLGKAIGHTRVDAQGLVANDIPKWTSPILKPSGIQKASLHDVYGHLHERKIDEDRNFLMKNTQGDV